MRVRKLLALTLAMVLVLGTFTFGFGATTNWIKVFLDEPATSVIAEYDNGDTEVLAEQGGHWNAPDYKDYVTNQIAAFIVDGYRYAPVEPYAGQEANGTVKYDLPTRQEAPMGTITVTKDVTNVDDDTTSFEFSISGGPESVPNDYVDESESTVIDVYYGDYTLTEIVPAGYTGLFTGDTVTVDENSTSAAVNFENEWIEKYAITIEKNVTGNKADEDDVFTFEIRDEQGALVDTVTASENTPEVSDLLLEGTYTVTELNPSPYTLTSGNDKVVELYGEDKTVEFTNNYNIESGQYQIIIDKTVTGNKADGDDEFEFEIRDSEGLVDTVTATGNTNGMSIPLDIGTYTVTELDSDNYKLESDNNKEVTLTDKNETVTFTNDYSRYDITVYKDVIGPNTDTEFTVALVTDEVYQELIEEPNDGFNGPPPEESPEGVISEGNPYIFTDLQPGTYWVLENPNVEGFYPRPDQMVVIEDGDEEVTVTNYQKPEITIEKTADKSSVQVGEDVTYTIAVTNTGGFDLPGVRITDEKIGLDETIALLEMGQTVTFTETTSYSQAGTEVNTATATVDVVIVELEDGLVALAPLYEENNQQNDLPSTSRSTSLRSFSTETDKGFISGEGFQENLKFLVANNGQEEDVIDTLTLTVQDSATVVVTDEEITYYLVNTQVQPEGSGTTTGAGEYEEGDSVTVTASPTSGYTFIDWASLGGEVAEVVSTDPNYTFTMPASDVSLVANFELDEVVDRPSMTIEKTVDDSSVYVNEDVTYTISVTNNGNVDLENVWVTDELLDFEEMIDLLEVGETETFTLTTSYSTTGERLNTAVAEYGIETEGYMSVEDSATVDVNRRPVTRTRTYRMDIDKEADDTDYLVGETITYTITVENTGNTTLTNIEVIDEMTGLEETIDSLSPTDIIEFETTYVAQTEDIGLLENTATAEDDMADPVEAEAIVSVNAVPLGVPGTYEITIEKTAITEGEIFFGDMVEFEIVVTNTGDEIIENILVEDNMVDFEAVINKLKPGESKKFKVKIEAPEIPGNFVNVATATSTETGTVEAEDMVWVQEPIPLDVPDTGVAPTDLFFGLGALVSGLGVFFTKKRKWQ